MALDPRLDAIDQVGGTATPEQRAILRLTAKVRDLERRLDAQESGASRATHGVDAFPAEGVEGATAVRRSDSRFGWFVNGLWRSTPPA